MITQRLKVEKDQAGNPTGNIVKDDGSLFTGWGHNYQGPNLNASEDSRYTIEDRWITHLYAANKIFDVNQISWTFAFKIDQTNVYQVVLTTSKTIPAGTFVTNQEFVVSNIDSRFDGDKTVHGNISSVGSNTITYFQGLGPDPQVPNGSKFVDGLVGISSIEFDFAVLKKSGSEIIRTCLDLGKFMIDENTINQTTLNNLVNYLDLAAKYDIYVILNGANTWLIDTQPDWLTWASEKERWTAQETFWSKIAEKVSNHPAVAWYSLINEPVIKDETSGSVFSLIENNLIVSDDINKYARKLNSLRSPLYKQTAITNATYNAGENKITYTTATAHNLIVADNVAIQGLAPDAYNLSGAVVPVTDVPTTTSFKVSALSNPGSLTDASGWVQPADIKLNDSSKFPTGGGIVKINSEYIRYTGNDERSIDPNDNAKSGQKLAIVPIFKGRRGIYDTLESNHNANAAVELYYEKYITEITVTINAAGSTTATLSANATTKLAPNTKYFIASEQINSNSFIYFTTGNTVSTTVTLSAGATSAGTSTAIIKQIIPANNPGYAVISKEENGVLKNEFILYTSTVSSPPTLTGVVRNYGNYGEQVSSLSGAYIAPINGVTNWFDNTTFAGTPYNFNPFLSLSQYNRTNDTVFRNWIIKIKNAIRIKDPNTPITIGCFGLAGNIATPAAPYNTRDLLDILSPHIYMDEYRNEIGHYVNSIKEARLPSDDPTATIMPVILEEGAVPLFVPMRDNVNYLLRAKKYLAGALNNYQTIAWYRDSSAFNEVFDKIKSFVNDSPTDDPNKTVVDFPNLPSTNRPSITGGRLLAPTFDNSIRFTTRRSGPIALYPKALTSNRDYKYLMTAIDSSNKETFVNTNLIKTVNIGINENLNIYLTYKNYDESFSIDKYRIWRYETASSGGVNKQDYWLIDDIKYSTQVDQGTATSTNATSLTDSTANWVTNQWSGAIVYAGSSISFVTSNTATRLNVNIPNKLLTSDPNWIDGTPSSNANYKIEFLEEYVDQNPATSLKYAELSVSQALTTNSTTVKLSTSSDGGLTISDFPNSGVIWIKGEYIRYTGKSGNDLTGLTRGYRNTTPASSTSARIYPTPLYDEYAFLNNDSKGGPSSNFDLVNDNAYMSQIQLSKNTSTPTETAWTYFNSDASEVGNNGEQKPIVTNLNSLTIGPNQEVLSVKAYNYLKLSRANLIATNLGATKKPISNANNYYSYIAGLVSWVNSNGNTDISSLVASDNLIAKLNEEAVVTSTLNMTNGLSTSGTSITVANASSFPSSGIIFIEQVSPAKNEYIGYTSKSGNVLTVGATPAGGRGALNSTAQSFNNGANVKVIYAGYTRAATNLVTVAIDWKMDPLTLNPGDIISKIDLRVSLKVDYNRANSGASGYQKAQLQIKSTDSQSGTFTYTSYGVGDYLGQWKASTYYAINDLVYNNSKIYKCKTAHTSGAAFSATNWDIYQDNAIVEDGFVELQLPIYLGEADLSVSSNSLWINENTNAPLALHGIAPNKNQYFDPNNFKVRILNNATSAVTNSYIAVNKIYAFIYLGQEVLKVQLYQDTTEQTSASTSFKNTDLNGWRTSGTQTNTGQFNTADSLDKLRLNYTANSGAYYLAINNTNLNILTGYVEVSMKETLARKGTPVATIV